jgi:hypothetical protein
MKLRTPLIVVATCTLAWLITSNSRGEGEAKQVKRAKTQLADMAWLAGHWRGKIGDDVIEETWSAPSGDSMTGVFRWLIKGEKTRLFEFLTITENPTGLEFRFRHFSRSLTCWEGMDDAWAYPNATVGEREAVFESPDRQNMKRMIYRIEESGGLLVRVEGYKEGKLSADDFRFTRVE